MFIWSQATIGTVKIKLYYSIDNKTSDAVKYDKQVHILKAQPLDSRDSEEIMKYPLSEMKTIDIPMIFSVSLVCFGIP